MTPISLASQWWSGLYQHQTPTPSFVYLGASKRDWHCDTCGRTGRILRCYASGLVTCAKCDSRFVVPVAELSDAEQEKLYQ